MHDFFVLVVFPGLTNYKTRFLLEALCAIKGVINGEEIHLFIWEGKLNRQNKNM